MNALVFAAPFSPLSAILAALAVAIAAVSIWRGLRGASLRLVACIALLALLGDPHWRSAEQTPLNDLVVLLVDESASQNLDGRAEATKAAAAALEERLKALGGVEVVRTAVAGVDDTRMVEAIRSAVADVPRSRLAATFVVTDGQTSDSDLASRLAVPAPVHIFNSGRAGEVDRKITLVKAPRYGIVRESVDISFRIDDFGPDGAEVSSGGSAAATLRVDGRAILTQPIPLGAEAWFTAPLDRPGRLIIELEVEPRPGELSLRNNLAVLEIAAIRDRLRVLLISGEPHAGERVWRNLLKSDPAVDLVHFTILRPLEKGDPNEVASELALIPFPQDELFIDKLSQFDLLIFDRFSHRGVLNSFHFDNIARYVEGGGAVLVATGPEFFGPLSLAERRNLAFILPATPSARARDGPFRPTLSAEGRRHPATAGLADPDIWGRWLRIAPATPRSGRTLMEGSDGLPLLILDRVGQGRVGLLLSDHVWLWARGFDGGGPHAELLRRIAHWLMKEPELEEERLSLSASGSDLLIRRRTMDEQPGPVALTDPDGETSEIALQATGRGEFSAGIARAKRGLYRARAGDLFAIGAVGLVAPPEFQNVVSDQRLLRPLADKAGGGVFRVRAGAGVVLPAIRRVEARGGPYAGAGWAGVVARHAARIESVDDAPLAPPFAWLLVLGAAILGAWALEGRIGRPRRTRRPG